MKQQLNIYRQLFLATITLLALFVCSLVVVSYIPLDSYQSTLEQSVATLQGEGTYPSVGLPGRQIVLDNYTDALMLNTAVAGDSSRPFYSAMSNTRAIASQDEINQTINLQALLATNTPLTVTYERYWHGYLVFLKPLLAIFSYTEIRYFLFGALMIGITTLSVMIWQRTSKRLAIALLIGLTAVDFWFIFQSMQFSSVFLIGIYSSIVYLWLGSNKLSQYALLFITGAVTSFFDLLTAPLVTLGFLMFIMLSQEVQKTNVLKASFFWSVGYLGLWAMKWLMVEFFVFPGALDSALNQVVNRTVTEADSNFDHFRAILLNVQQLVGYSFVSRIAFLGGVVLASGLLIRYFSFPKKALHTLLPWLFVGLLPYAWYLVAANHSYLHVWFTYRTQLLSVTAFVMMYLQLIHWQTVKQDFKSLVGKK